MLKLSFYVLRRKPEDVRLQFIKVGPNHFGREGPSDAK